MNPTADTIQAANSIEQSNKDMDVLVRRLNQCTERLVSNSQRLGTINDRLFGAVPTEANAAEGKLGSGVVNEAMSLCDALGIALNRLEAEVDRTSQIA